MRKTTLLGIVLLVGCLTSGCAVFLVGSGVLGGLAISEDTVQSNLDRPMSRIWRVALQETKKAGGVTLQDEEHGRLEADVESAHVWISIDQLTPKTVRLKVKARKNLLPKMELAQKLSTRILKHL